MFFSLSVFCLISLFLSIMGILISSVFPADDIIIERFSIFTDDGIGVFRSGAVKISYMTMTLLVVSFSIFC